MGGSGGVVRGGGGGGLGLSGFSLDGVANFPVRRVVGG